jgi:hypothetical protein
VGVDGKNAGCVICIKAAFVASESVGTRHVRRFVGRQRYGLLTFRRLDLLTAPGLFLIKYIAYRDLIKAGASWKTYRAQFVWKLHNVSRSVLFIMPEEKNGYSQYPRGAKITVVNRGQICQHSNGHESYKVNINNPLISVGHEGFCILGDICWCGRVSSSFSGRESHGLWLDCGPVPGSAGKLRSADGVARLALQA